MGSRINNLLKKYWQGDTSKSEELELHSHFSINPSLTSEGKYFREINKMKSSEPDHRFLHPGRSQRKKWWSVAATLAVGIAVGLLVMQDISKRNQFLVEDPEEAYEITKKALMMISSSMNEGASYTGEMKKFNEAEELIKNKK